MANADKEAADKAAAAKRAEHDPNTTLSAEREAVPRPRAEGFGVAPADLMTEQEKGKPDPVGKAQHSPGPVRTIEEEGIGPRTPYPTGNPAGTREEGTRTQAVKDNPPADKPDTPDKTRK